MNYIGSKYSLVDFIKTNIIQATNFNQNYIFADLFAGTGVIGSEFRAMGAQVIANDLQYYSFVLNKHFITSNADIEQDLIDYLNNIEGIEGFIYNNYCQGSNSGRNYFSDSNGKKCDAIRLELERLYLNKEINENIYYTLLASLINSIDKVANTASVYGAFLKHLKSSAQKEFKLELLKNINGKIGMVYNADINHLINNISGDILYLDPPYNSRQYASNYHVLETIAKYDTPILKGKSGLRDYQHQKSVYCSKKTVETAFEYIIKNAKFKYIFLSYNNEGLMSLDSIQKIMKTYGKYKYFTKQYKRFKSDNECNRNILANQTIEYLHMIEKVA